MTFEAVSLPKLLYGEKTPLDVHSAINSSGVKRRVLISGVMHDVTPDLFEESQNAIAQVVSTKSGEFCKVALFNKEDATMPWDFFAIQKHPNSTVDRVDSENPFFLLTTKNQQGREGIAGMVFFYPPGK